MKFKFLLAASIVAMPLVGVAVTLEETVREVLNTNPVIQQRVKYFRAVKQDVGIAEAGYYPKLDLVAGAGRERTNNNSTGYVDRTLDRTESAIVLSQNLFEGFGTKNNVDRQLYRVDSAAFSVMEQANKTSLNMIEAYINLFKQKELLMYAEKNIESHQAITKKIQERIDSGVGANSEIEQSSSRLSLAQSNYIVQMNNYEDTMSNFIKVYGKYISPEDLVEPMMVKNLPATKDEALKLAKVNNPSLYVQKANIKVAKSNYNISEKEFLPKIDLELRQDWNYNIGGVRGSDDSRAIMLRVKYNLYNGNADTSSKQQKISQWQQEMESYTDLVRSVEESLRLSWMAYVTLEKQMEYLLNHQSLSEKALKSYQEEFDLGRRTLLDILDTEEELYSSNRELTIAKYDHIFAQYRILESIGSLSSYINPKFGDIVGLGEKENSKADVVDMMVANEIK